RATVLGDRPVRLRAQLGDVLLEIILVLRQRWMERHIEIGMPAEEPSGDIARDQPEILDRFPYGRANLRESLGRRLDAVQRDEQSQNLVRALEDAIDASVAEETLIGVWLDKAAPAGDLHHLVGRAPDEITREHFETRGLERIVGIGAIHRRREQPEHGIGGVRIRGERRQLALCDLEVRQRMPELHTLAGVLGHKPDELLRAASAAGAERQAAAIEHVDGDEESLADGAEYVVGG